MRPTQIAVDVAEQGGGRAETIPVGDGRPLARLPVLARNAECAVALLAEGGSALSVRGFSARGYISYSRSSQGSPWATRSTARVLSSASGAPVSTEMFHGWMFDPDGDQPAADSTRSSNSLDTGSSVNPRTARRLLTASYTSMIAYLPPAIRYALTPVRP